MKRQKETVRAIEPHGGNAADLECVLRIAAGDAESLGDLYDRHATVMYSLALRILRREADADDVVHTYWRTSGARPDETRRHGASWELGWWF